jgi:hypothetical protein
MTTIDRIEVLLDRTVALLLVKFPVRTGLGVAIGGALSLVVRILEPVVRKNSIWPLKWAAGATVA